MDIFMEHIVKHKRTMYDNLKVVGILSFTFVLCIIASVLTMIVFPILQSISVFVLVAIAYGGVYFIKKTNVEYEYILTNNELDIDRIIAKSSRKRLITVDFKEIDICARINDESHKYEYDNKEGITKTIDCTGDGENGVYFIDFAKDSGKIRIFIQPPVKFIESAYKYNPRKVFI